MSRAIPRVREWKITLEDGQAYRVNAPTKRLALLNFRGHGYYDAVRSVGAIRNQIGQRETVEPWKPRRKSPIADALRKEFGGAFSVEDWGDVIELTPRRDR